MSLCSYHNVKKQPPHRGGFRGFLETKFPGKQTRDLPAGALDLLERMLRLDPKKRISAMEAFKARPCTSYLVIGRCPRHVLSLDPA